MKYFIAVLCALIIGTSIVWGSCILAEAIENIDEAIGNLDWQY